VGLPDRPIASELRTTAARGFGTGQLSRPSNKLHGLSQSSGSYVIEINQRRKQIMFLNKRVVLVALAFAMAAVLNVKAADDVGARLGDAAAVLARFTDSSGRGISPHQFAKADCVAVIPGFKKGAAGVGVGYGRGFISCRNGEGWSAPGAVTLETASLGVQLGGEEIDIVILSRDKGLRAKLLADRFTVGSDASAEWGNGKSAHGDSDAKVLFFGQTKGAFAGFGLDGATLKADDTSNAALYGKTIKNSAIVNSGAGTPEAAQPLVAALTAQNGH
jgi:SH3 domain-containing YSC84-like protein 1